MATFDSVAGDSVMTTPIVWVTDELRAVISQNIARFAHDADDAALLCDAIMGS